MSGEPWSELPSLSPAESRLLHEGNRKDNEITKLTAERDKLKAEVTRLTALNAKLYNEIYKVLKENYEPIEDDLTDEM